MTKKFIDDDTAPSDEDLTTDEEVDEISVSSLRRSGAQKAKIQGFEDLPEDLDDLLPEDEELLFPVPKATPTNFLGHDPEDFGPHLPREFDPRIEKRAESLFFPMQALLSLEAQVEAVIFASPKSVKVGDILEIIGGEDVAAREVQDAINRLMIFYEERGGGFKLEHVRGGGYQFRTSPAAAPLMEKIFASRPRPLSRAAQETLAIIAYRQPATRADIEFIRGVDAGSIIKNLLERDLIKCVGRKEDSGRPMVFGTTDEFLRVYQLDSLKELPPLDSFQPSQDTMQTATSKLASAADDDEVDVEEFMEDRDEEGEEYQNHGMQVVESEIPEAQALVSDGIGPDDDIQTEGVFMADKEIGEEELFDTLASGDIEPPLEN